MVGLWICWQLGSLVGQLALIASPVDVDGARTLQMGCPMWGKERSVSWVESDAEPMTGRLSKFETIPVWFAVRRWWWLATNVFPFVKAV